MTTSRNSLLTGVIHDEGGLYHGHVPVDDSTSHINQGDLVYWDSTSHTAKALDSDAHAATLLGLALGASKANSNLDNSATVAEPDINVGYGFIASFFTTSGDTYAEGDAVYLGADAQTITNTAGMMTHPVGIVRLPPRGAAVAGGSGITVPVLVYSKAFVDFSA